MPFVSSLLKKNKTVLIAIFVLSLATVAIYWQFFLRGLSPFPGDLLVSFFFPWNSGGFPGFNPWTTHKEFIASDVIRQMYPWKVFAFDLIRHWQMPLWNPYNFSGYPLLANLQSSIFFFGNFFFLLLPPLPSWIILVITTMGVFGLGNFLFFRSLKLSLPACLFGALVSMNISYLVVWQEQLIITQVALFLPFILWAINRYADTGRKIFWLLIMVFLAGAIYGGHAQTFIYLYIVVATYLLFKKIPLPKIVLFLGLPLLLGAAQLLPTVEIYLHSARESAATQTLFTPFVLPWANLPTLLAPDFFGNPATGNFWGQHYGDFQYYFGVAGLVFALLGIYCSWKSQTVRLFTLIAAAGIFFAAWPLALLLKNVPILGSGVPARAIFLFQYGLTVVAAFGFDWWLSNRRFSKKVLLTVFLVATGFALLWIWPQASQNPYSRVSQANLLLPTAVFLATSICLFLPKLLSRIPARVVILPLLLLPILEASYFFNKYQPFAPAKFVFPPHPVLSYLQEQAGYNRFYGLGTAYIDNNFATYYRIFSAEGWDSLYIRRYGELLSSTANGQVPEIFPRSDALFSREENFYRSRIMDLLAVRYLIVKNDSLTSTWSADSTNFPPDRFRLVWQDSPWQSYERLTALPRAFLVNNYLVVPSKQVIATLYQRDFPYQSTAILEADPKISLLPSANGFATITDYQPNKIVISVISSGNQLLILSDNAYPGWQATVDGKFVPVYTADYILRAVPVSQGSHQVVISYDPWSFKLGVLITALTTFSLSAYYFLKKKL